MAEDENSEGNLRWRRTPVHWDACEVRRRPEPSVVIMYHQAGTAFGPGAPLAEIVVSFGSDVVAVSLFERRIGGVRPDGAVMARSLKRVTGFVRVLLPSDPEARRIIDGTRGRPGDPLELADAEDGLPYGEGGCPLWVP